MINDEKEYLNWLESEQDKVHERYVAKKLDRKSPRLEKHRDVRKSRPHMRYSFSKEDPVTRRLYQRKVRRILNRKIHDEGYYHVYAKDYKTYGWMTW